MFQRGGLGRGVDGALRLRPAGRLAGGAVGKPGKGLQEVPGKGRDGRLVEDDRERQGAAEETSKQALNRIAHKLPIRVKMVPRRAKA